MQMTYMQAVSAALQEEMRRDEKILMFGEDIAEFGNIFGVTRGMLEEFGPKRVRNTSISETAIIGTADFHRLEICTSSIPRQLALRVSGRTG